MEHGYTYEGALAASEGIRWRVEDIIGGDKRLDFTKHFMPESLARVERLTFLTPGEKLKLNQIRGGVYLCIFGLVDQGLQQQVEFDLDAFQKASGRELNLREQEEFREVQLQANRWTYLGTAMTHENVLRTLEGLSPAARSRVEGGPRRPRPSTAKT